MGSDNAAKNEAKEIAALIDRSRLMDDNLMTLVFDGNIEATQLVLNIILDRKDLIVKNVQVQKEEKNSLYNGRNVKIDIFAEDADGNRFDIEIQRSDEGAGFYRARFLSAALDHGMLEKSQKFGDIKDSYVIFITENDVLKGDLALYHFERQCVELKTYANDGNHIIYANGAYHDNSTAIGRLMHDFRCRNAGDMFYGPLRNAVRHYKETEGGRERMSKDIEQYGNERAKEGAAKRAKETAERMIRDGALPDEKIAQYSGLTVEQVQKIRSDMLVTA